MSNRRVTKVRRAPVRETEVLGADGARTRLETVYCRTRGAGVGSHHCADCARAVDGPSSDGVTCYTDTLELDRPAAPRRAGWVDLREAASVVCAGEVIGRKQLTVTVDATVERLSASLLERRASAAPVVDDDGRLVGIVTQADVVRASSQAGSGATRVGDLMALVAHSLPESAPLAFAFGLLAASGAGEVPIVEDDGRVVGMITALDLVRWVARDLGYVLPE